MIETEVAVSIFRGLSGTDGFPFHEEGQKRFAAVLIECCEEVSHARAVIAEYEGDTCPSIESIRATARRLSEKCGCGVPLWNHAERGCGHFAPPADDEWKRDAPTAEEAKRGWDTLRSQNETIMDRAREFSQREKFEINPAVLRFLGRTNFQTVNHDEIAFAKRELGYLQFGYPGYEAWLRDANEFEKRNPQRAAELKAEGLKRVEEWRARRVTAA